MTLRLEKQGVEQLIAALENASRLTGLLALDLTCANGPEAAGDVQDLYNTSGTFATRTARTLRMAARRLQDLEHPGHQGTGPGQDPDPAP